MEDKEQAYRELLARLNPKEQHFVREYLIHKNATLAAKRAGYSEHTAYSIGHEVLKKPELAAAVQAGLDAIAARCEVTVERVVRELAAVAFASAHDYRATSDGSLAVGEGSPEESGLALQVKHRRVVKSDGSIETDTSYSQQDKVKALELLGKKLRLWVDKVEVEDAQDQLYRELLKGLKERK